VIDTHCHLTFPDFQEDRSPGGVAAVLQRAAAKGVSGCITISTTHPDAVAALSVAKAHANVWCSAGVHPLYSDEGPHDWNVLRLVASDPRCVAWGELGLDNHYTEPARAVQHEVLAEQLAFIQKCAGEGLCKPIILHCREAFSDLIPILKRTALDPGRFVFHCFTGTPDDMRHLLDFGALVSFTGVVTYKNASGVRDALKLVPADRFMFETDAPFLSPEPHRTARPCEPWMASLTAQRIAEVRGEPLHDMLAQVDRTVQRFFSIP